MDDQIDRLNRIEGKLDKVSEAIISLARMEERMIALFKRMDVYDTQQSALENRIAKVELNNASSAWVERFAMMVIGGLISVVVYLGK